MKKFVIMLKIYEEDMLNKECKTCDKGEAFNDLRYANRIVEEWGKTVHAKIETDVETGCMKATMYNEVKHEWEQLYVIVEEDTESTTLQKKIDNLVIKEFEEYVKNFRCACTSDEYDLEVLKAVLELVKREDKNA